jgi:hypothetical protein
MTTGLADRLMIDRLDSLLPYLHLMSDFSLGEMLTYCGRYGQLYWARTHLRAELARRGKLERPTDDKDFLDRMVLEWMPSEEDIFAELQRIADRPEHVHSTLDHVGERWMEQGGSPEDFCMLAKKWFDQNPSMDRVPVVAVALEFWGKRSDLAFLESMYAVFPRPPFPALHDARFRIMRRSLD